MSIVLKLRNPDPIHQYLHFLRFNCIEKFKVEILTIPKHVLKTVNLNDMILRYVETFLYQNAFTTHLHNEKSILFIILILSWIRNILYFICHWYTYVIISIVTAPNICQHVGKGTWLRSEGSGSSHPEWLISELQYLSLLRLKYTKHSGELFIN